MINKYFSRFFLIISLTLLIYVTYRSEILYNGNNRDYYKIYYYISSLLIFLSIISFYLDYKFKLYFFITLISISFSIYAFELYYTYQNNFFTKPAYQEVRKAAKIYKDKTSKNYDLRDRSEIYFDKRELEELTLDIEPSIFLNDKSLKILPLSGVSKFKTINCNENGYYSIFLSDRYGFNNPDDQWNENEIEYTLIGDSFVHGDCVNRPYDIASNLRTLSNKPVINLGFGGNGPLLEFATLKEYLKPNTKNIIWVFTDNDLRNLETELENKILLKYFNDQNFKQNLINFQSEINRIVHDKLEFNLSKGRETGKFDLLKFLKFYNTRLLFSTYTFEIKPQFSQILKLANDFSKKNGSNFYFVYLPQYQNYQSNYDEEMYKKVIQEAKKLNLRIIDIKEEFENENVDKLKLFPFNMYGHYTEYGYKVISDIIFKQTKD